jgi:hypothetical protein
MGAGGFIIVESFSFNFNNEKGFEKAKVWNPGLEVPLFLSDTGGGK